MLSNKEIILPNKVSIIIPCYKMGAYLSQALTSISNQTHKNWEVIIVDDCGPDDNTINIANSFRIKYGAAKVQVLRHASNQGVSAARNTALHNATGEYIAFLDPDDLWLPNHLTVKLEFLQTNPKFQLCFSPAYHFTTIAKKNSSLECPSPWELNSLPYSLGFRCSIALSSVVLTRTQLILFDTTPDIQHVEDWDLWLRLAFNGIQFGFSPTITTFYRKHSGGATYNSQLNTRRILSLARKHGSLLTEYQTVGFGSMIYAINHPTKNYSFFNPTRTWRERLSLSGLKRFLRYPN